MHMKYLLLFSITYCLSFSYKAQISNITISGKLNDLSTKEVLPFVNVILKKEIDSSFVAGTITDETGVFSLDKVSPGSYIVTISFSGYEKRNQSVYVGSTSPFLDLGTIELKPLVFEIGEVTVTGQKDEIDGKMDKKTYSLEENVSNSGGSVLQAVQNLPGITIQDNKVQLRGNDKVLILIDGKQSALTGYGGQSGLDNIPASSIERIEIINNPSSKYDANGNAGIINLIMKKEKKDGFNGKIGMAGGLGALWMKKANLPSIRTQYQNTPKFNPSISLNYRKKNTNLFLQVDDLYSQTLNKNEFTTRTYDDGTVINQQVKRNRNTNFLNSKIGLDWSENEKNSFTVFGLFGSEKIIDRGDQPFFNSNNTERLRLWQFVEDELKTTVMGSASIQHKFKIPGRQFNTGVNYTFHRENEKYDFTNILPTFTGVDAFKLLSDEHVLDFNLDYSHPLKYGKLETGAKFRYRMIPTNMQFFPSSQSPLDSAAGGKATYNEIIPALYANYFFESKKWEGELGLRAEYVGIQYQVNPNHPIYKSDGYSYIRPFPSVRLVYKLTALQRISFFYNRRVDRPNEVDIRIFPKYDDAEIVKVGNPSLKPQFTNSLELGYKLRFKNGYWYTSLYGKSINGTMTRISTVVPGSTMIYNIFQNTGMSYQTGIESIWSHDISKFVTYNIAVNVYYNEFEAFTVENKYPVSQVYTSSKNSIYSGNAKLNANFHLKNNFDIQLTAIYLAPDVIPQGKIGQRFSLNLGAKKSVQKGKGEFFVNASDLLNTMVIKRDIVGNGFRYTSADYYETQVVRVGYSYKF
jgi:outer membrane receptor protein involved in Fe transport